MKKSYKMLRLRSYIFVRTDVLVCIRPVGTPTQIKVQRAYQRTEVYHGQQVLQDAPFLGNWVSFLFCSKEDFQHTYLALACIT